MVDSIGTETNRSYVDWPAIFAGAVIASGAMAVLTTFAGGLGLSSISVDDGGEVSSIWLIDTTTGAETPLAIPPGVNYLVGSEPRSPLPAHRPSLT